MSILVFSGTARLAIDFFGESRVTVDLETDVSNERDDTLCLFLLFSHFALRQMCNLGSEYGPSLAEGLIQLARPGVLQAVDERNDPVLEPVPNTTPDRRFLATLSVAPTLCNLSLRTRGFGLLARGMPYYASTAAVSLLRHLYRIRMHEPDYLAGLTALAGRVAQSYLREHPSPLGQARVATDAVLSVYPSALRMGNTNAAPVANTSRAKRPMVVISTSMGDIHAELYADKAPDSVKNFLAYADSGHYNNTIFHRVIKDFMIQGGGMTADLQQKATKAPIKNEAHNGLKNTVGTLAMARTSVVNSATSQFFINVKDNAFLDYKSKTPEGYGYAVFGKVIGGMDVVKNIELVSTTSKGMHQDVPTRPVIIESVTISDRDGLGRPVTTPLPTSFCCQCGATHSADANFCAVCGTRIAGTPKATQPPPHTTARPLRNASRADVIGHALLHDHIIALLRDQETATRRFATQCAIDAELFIAEELFLRIFMTLIALNEAFKDDLSSERFDSAAESFRAQCFNVLGSDRMRTFETEHLPAYYASFKNPHPQPSAAAAIGRTFASKCNATDDAAVVYYGAGVFQGVAPLTQFIRSIAS